jgi:hypothetical protein
MQEASKNFQGCNTEGTQNVVFTKFFTDAMIGLDWNEVEVDSSSEMSRGRAVPQLREQYVRGAPSIVAEDYEDRQTPFGLITAHMMAQLTPLYVNLQSYALKNFAMRSAAKLQTSVFFVMFRIVLPFFILRSPYGRYDETSDPKDMDGRGRIFVTPRRCRTEDKDMDTACPVNAFIEHSFKQTMFALALVFVDVTEIVTIMRAWTGKGRGNAAHPVMLEAHGRFMNNICARFGYGFVILHIIIRGWTTLRDCFQIVFGEFNENYCKGEDREASYCYKYNRENGVKSRV